MCLIIRVEKKKEREREREKAGKEGSQQKRDFFKNRLQAHCFRQFCVPFCLTQADVERERERERKLKIAGVGRLKVQRDQFGTLFC